MKPGGLARFPLLKRLSPLTAGIATVAAIALLLLTAPLVVGSGLYHASFDAATSTRVGGWILYEHSWLSKYLFGRVVVIEGSSARKAAFEDPSSIVVAPDGRIFVSDRRDHRIHVISEGRIRTFIGDGVGGFSGDGEERQNARVNFPEGMAISEDGHLIFADAHNHRIREVAPSGLVRTLAGNGEPGLRGDGGPATRASLRRPSDVCQSHDGSIFIADVGNHSVRRVTPSGIIQTMAGTGRPGYSGDGGPGTEAQLNQPWGVACLPGGGVLIADSENHRVRRLEPDGSIKTVLGSGRKGLGREGVAALQAELDSPQEVLLDGRGGYFVVDEHNHRIRHVNSQGYVRTVVGTGERGTAAAGTRGTDARLDDPEDVWVSSGGSLLIAEGDNYRILGVDEANVLRVAAGR